MLAWTAENIGTIIIALALCAIVAGVIAALARDRKKGRCSCGSSCRSCPMSGKCHSSPKNPGELPDKRA